jgi:hypothetical protein
MCVRRRYAARRCRTKIGLRKWVDLDCRVGEARSLTARRYFGCRARLSPAPRRQLICPAAVPSRWFGEQVDPPDCHMGEQHCGELRITVRRDADTFPMATQRPRRLSFTASSRCKWNSQPRGT